MLSIVVAMTPGLLIGVNNQLPWRQSSDLKRFKELTMGKPLLMGRKTLQSIGKALPGRRNLILTKQSAMDFPDCELVNSIDHALQLIHPDEELMVIGGATLYEQTIDKADKLYITWIQAELSGDTYFPEFDLAQWQFVFAQAGKADEKNQYDYRFVEYIRQK